MTTLIDIIKTSVIQHNRNYAYIYDNGQGEVEMIKYEQLIEEAMLVSGALEKFCAPENEIVSISVQQTSVILPLVLGIWISKASFYFISPKDDPPEVTETLIKLGSGIMLQPSADRPKDEFFTVLTSINLRGCSIDVCRLNVVDTRRKYNLDNHGSLAYAIKTSASTGKSKLVLVPSSCILPNIQHLSSLFHMSKTDTVLVCSPWTFDPSIIDLGLALTNGATLLLVPDTVKENPVSLLKIITKHRVTVMQTTPALIERFGISSIRSHLLTSPPNHSLRILALGGEHCPNSSVLASWEEIGNTTEMFNLYGITEVSSWATCYKIGKELLDLSNQEIPLGEVLQETILKIVDEVGNEIISEGEGQIFIGGTNRACLIDEEPESILEESFKKGIPIMRPTGDIGRLTANGNIYYVGRTDDIIKRFGKKLNLRILEEVCLQCKGVQRCSVTTSLDKKYLYLSVIPSESVETINKKDLIRRIKRHIISTSPAHSIPDFVVILKEFPVTSHGKIDKRKLAAEFSSDDLKNTESNKSIKHRIENIWKDILGMDQIELSNTFTQCGGNSFLAVQFLNLLEGHLKISSDNFYEKLLNSTFDEFVEMVDRPTEKNSGDFEKGSERLEKATYFKRQITTLPEASEELPFVKLTGNEIITRDRMRTNISERTSENCVYFPCIELSDNYKNKSLELVWKFDMGKCIDSSPCFIKSSDKSPNLVCVGSHSHHLAAVNVRTGDCIWKVRLGDRIESSPSPSSDGKLIFVGSYDKSIYAIDSSNGAIKWKYETMDVVKSSAYVDSVSNCLYCGSHDGFLHAISMENGKEIWKAKPGTGSVFSAPCKSSNPEYVCVGTLDGTIAALNCIDGAILWKLKCDKPIFSSPTLTPEGVCIGCADGRILALNHNGQIIWSYQTNAPIFSSCTVLPIFGWSICCGSHDGFLYCISKTGHLIWKIFGDGPIYSKPCAFYGIISQNLPPKRRKNENNGTGDLVVWEFQPNQEIKDSSKKLYVVNCSTKGLVQIIGAEIGEILCDFKLPGEVFSSPIIVENGNLIVGCRDNFLYCLKILF